MYSQALEISGHEDPISMIESTKVAQVEIKNQYGQQVVIPRCETSEIFAQIAGTKTLTKPTIDAMKRLGYEIEVLQTLPTKL